MPTTKRPLTLLAAVLAAAVLLAGAADPAAAARGRPAKPKPTPTPTPVPYLEGIDVSHWQGVVDWPAVARAGKRFVFAKATEGIGYTDPRWAANKAGARAAGLVLGAYHFARPDLNPSNPAGEADWFATTMALERGMLLPVIDLETAGSMTVTARVEWVRAFLARLHERTGARAIIYTSPAWWSKYMGDTTWFAENGYGVLWVAHWTTATAPLVPAANWGGRSWTFWQYTSSGSVSGISGNVDLNRYRGTSLAAVTW